MPRSIVGTSTTSTSTITLPSGVEAGDLILVHFHAASSSNITVTGGPSGYTLDGAVNQSGAAYTYGAAATSILLAYSKVSAGSDSSANVSITTAAAGVRGLAVVLRGVDTDAYQAPSWVYATTNASSAPLAIPISLAAGRVFVGWAGSNYDFASFIVSDGFEVTNQEAFGTDRIGLIGPVGGTAAEDYTSLELYVDGPLLNGTHAMAYDDNAIPELVPEPAYPESADAGDRLRSRVSEDTGSVLDSVEARVVDASLSVDFTNAVTLEPLTLTNYRDALRATDSATVDAAFYPRPVQNTSEEQQFDGITLLSRLASWYPPPIFDTVTNLGIVSSGTATAQQVIQHVLDEWATAADWFTAAAAPDLRLRINGYAPSDYTATDGLVLCETVTIAQDGENRRTARQILDDLLSPFPSTIVRQNSSGNLEIVPVYGPDADETAHLTLANDDLYSVSQGKPDPWLIKNRATATCTGYSRQEEVEVMQPAWFQVGSNYQLGKDTWYAPPSDRLNLQPPPDGFDTLQESLSSGEFSQQRPALWPRSSSNIPAGTGISLRDGSNNATITVGWSRYNDTSLQNSGSTGLTLLEDEVPFDGEWRNTIKWDSPDDGANYTIACRWNAARGGVEFQFRGGLMEVGCVTGCKGYVVEFTLNDSSVGYATGVRKSATFGVIDDANPDQSDTLPSTTGNAIEESQTAYGVLEATINIRGYDLDVGTLREIATAYVVENITPRVTRDLDVSTWGVGLTFDAIGRLIELPSGESGVLTSVEYADDFTAKTLRRTARVQLKNTTATGALDTTSTLYTTTKSGNDYLATTAGEIYKTTG